MKQLIRQYFYSLIINIELIIKYLHFVDFFNGETQFLFHSS
ncbi:MAG: hypothetical protein JWQ34_2573 [Mucilaginibacter sp.]|nr:hypothetical protein [Mucilaginibacter sp.]